jgi:hypothetical protein
MKPLETSFKKYGHLFSLIVRDQHKALYERTTTEGHHICYELIKVRVAKPKMFKDQLIPEREVYPSDEQLGTYGWSLLYHSRESALDRYNSLIRPDQNPLSQGEQG